MSKEQLHELVNRLPESEVKPAARYLEFLIAHDEQPVDSEMLARIDAARAHPSLGIPHQEILREFGV
ncbi:MAG: hypothetical protein ABSG65_35035 [Bryobacteraceae bacterium]|jgi:hypothetical protein